MRGVCFLIGCWAAAAACAAPPERWVSRGPGGGGAFFSPAINPYNPDEAWVGSDMSDLFHSRDFGREWDTVDFRVLQGGNQDGRMRFTAVPHVRYALNGGVPSRSLDSGVTWTSIPHNAGAPSVYALHADPGHTGRLMVSTYTTLYLSTNAGATWRGVYTNTDLLFAGVFWDGDVIAAGTRPGVALSTNGGATFSFVGKTGIPAGEELVSFAGAREGAAVRWYAVTFAAGDAYPGVQGSSYESYRGVYRLDGGTGAWVVATNGLGANRPFLLGLSPTNAQLVYAAGEDGLGQPSVVKSVNGGVTWTQVLRCTGNANVATGWSGDDPGAWNWKKWSFGECAMGFTVCASDPARAMITDFGFIHVTTNGGASWRQAYVWAQHENAIGAAAIKTNFYAGNGAEDTSCWWLSWFDSNTLFCSFTDIRGMWSTNGGRAWMNPPTLAYNSTYCTVQHPTNGFVYGAMSSVHDLYAWDRYCQDAYIDGGSGAIMVSTNKGRAWATLKNLGRPVVHVALDPNRPERLYASMVHSASGGIYRTTNLSAGAASVWTALAVPPRTQGHPYNIHVLDDGTLVATYSARIASGNFQPSAGVFVSTNDGASWLDRSDTNLHYYTKDLTVDPHDPAQQTWYAGVWGEWGNSSGRGGLYRTTNRGLAWTRITTNLKAVSGCAIAPDDPDEMYVLTEDQGLWHSANRRAAQPVFEPVAGYPFRFPTRVFYNPHDLNEVWVTSFGNGPRLARRVEPEPVLHALSVASNEVRVAVRAAHGQRVELQAGDAVGAWTGAGAQRAFVEDLWFTLPDDATRLLRAEVRE